MGLDQTIDRLLKVAHSRDPTLFVVGLPLTLQNEDSAFTRVVRSFIERLSLRVAPISVVEWDERLSSAGADRELRGLGFKREERAARSDLNAACAILQSYLDYINRTS